MSTDQTDKYTVWVFLKQYSKYKKERPVKM